MKRLILFVLSLLLAITISCNRNSEATSFERAKPVWSEGREREQNLTLSFREKIDVPILLSAEIRLTASCDYRLRVNGEFVAHGPCVAAHDFYRIDVYDLTPYLHRGENLVAIEVAGYNSPSYYLLDQPSFLQAEIELNGRVVASTGESFEAYALGQRVADVPKFSFQRPHAEEYILAADYDDWAVKMDWHSDIKPEKLVEQEPKVLLARGVAYPDYTLHQAEQLDSTLYKFSTNSTGFLRAKVVVEKPSRLVLRFDEILGEDGRVMERRLSWRARVVYDLQAGEYELESFEPYTMQYVEIFADEGVEVKEVSMRDYCNSEAYRAKFQSSREELNRLFEASRRNYRQNVLDVYMDCPGRERTGWLGDSYFTSRAEFSLTGASKVERNFLENYLLPKAFKDIDKGMLPMCYPADHRNGNYIPNFAMWFVLELEEYLHRTGDVATVERARQRVYELLDYYKRYENEQGLLERLDKWVFVDYSFSNKCVQDISYPSNMLYAKMLDTVARLYDDKPLAEQAEQIRKVVLAQSYNGKYFVDNAYRNAKGEIVQTENTTEACQYYAFFCDVATPQSHPELWERLCNDFRPSMRKEGAYPEVPASNVFIGNYLRFEQLSKEGMCAHLLDEVVALYIPMVDLTGTIWEFFKPKASCNHGFGSHIAYLLYRDALGAYKIAPCEKRVYLRFADSGQEWCRGSIPVGGEMLDIEWERHNDTYEVKLKLPKGYSYEIIPTEYKVVVEN